MHENSSEFSAQKIIRFSCVQKCTKKRISISDIRTRGSHAILTKQDREKGKITIPVPLHLELAKGTLKSIMNQVGLKLEDLLKLS